MTRRGINPIEAAMIIVIMYMLMPIVSVFISRYITTYAYMLILASLLGFVLLMGGIKRLNAIIYLMFPLIILMFCSLFLNHDSIFIWGYNQMLFLMPIILGYYFMYYRAQTVPFYAKVIIVMLIITTITTIIGLIRFPFAARTLATTESSDESFLTYSWNNIGSYDFVYIAVLLYPILILAYKLKRIKSVIFWMLVVLLFSLVILSEYTTALILIMLTSVLCLPKNKMSAQQFMVTGVFFFLAIFLLWPVFSKFLLWLSGVLSSETLSERLTSLANGYSGLENSESHRIELYRASLEGFMSSPLFGEMLGSTTRSGGHSHILDLLSDYGIIGGAALFFSYRNIYKYFFKPFSNLEGYGLVLWSFVQTIILSSVNTSMWLNVLSFFIPVLLMLIYNINSEGLYENSLDSKYAN